ncbi:MAG: GNAT family N-acetyltransferase [Myxococcaceae bacterium]|nr:MAG: GNAT family N-acetyltransferase [Myxococcaceae bacterium]
MTTPAAASWVRAATPEDWNGIERLLTDRHLPTAGAREHLSAFVVATKGAAVLGCAGIERYGDLGLLRSVAVTENVAGLGVGAELVRAVLDRARALGLREVYLLTTTAVRYFPRFGFDTIGREALPSSLAASEELRGACPASAVAMRLTL